MSTDVVIVDPVPAERLFHHLRGILGRSRGVPDPTWSHNPEPSRCCGPAYSTEPQGLPAWLWVFYGADGPMELLSAGDIESRQGSDPGWQVPSFQVHAVRVNFDTAYGYKAANGAHCGDLHAWLICQVADWLAEHHPHTRWGWEHESGWDYYSGWTLGGPPDPLLLELVGDPALGALPDLLALPPG